MFKVKNRNTRRSRSGVFIINFEHISHLALALLLLTLCRQKRLSEHWGRIFVFFEMIFVSEVFVNYIIYLLHKICTEKNLKKLFFFEAHTVLKHVRVLH